MFNTTLLFCSDVKNVGVNEDGMYWAKMISIVRQEILDYKSELDALAIKRMQMGRKLKQVGHVSRN